MAQDNERDFEELLLMLKETRGFDLTGYKPTTLMRRVRRRMGALSLETFAEYRDYLELEPDEFAQLFDSLLINVTGFFRDPPAWNALWQKVIPEVLASKPPNRPLRLWSAGCATGEEAYTLAILMTEALGTEAFLERVKIYATDLDEDALQQARTGTYAEKQFADVPDEYKKTYFEPNGNRYTFRRDLRRQVIFGRNDLTHDAPISQVDLLVARNTLMYFNAETQVNIIRRFHFALADNGFLFLGKAEMLLNHSDRFEPVDLRKRLFRKLPAAVTGIPPRPARSGYNDVAPHTTQLEGAALSGGPVAQLAVDLAGLLAVANHRAEALFGLRPRDVGRPFQDLEVSYRPVELRSIIERVKRDQRQVKLSDVVWHRAPAQEAEVFDVHAVPLFGGAGDLAGVGINFVDVTRYRRLRDELEHSHHELELAYEELQSLNEELETTNEELQSTNEELETTNEELQSTNEELETMNEELQSTNDELQEINDALRLRTDELDAANSFLGSVLRGLGGAVVVVDRELRVQVWGPGADEMWGIRPDEAEGQQLRVLDIGLPVQEITPLLNRMLTGREHGARRLTMSAVNRRGKAVRLEVECCPLLDEDSDHQVKGAILVMNQAAEDQPSASHQASGQPSGD